jgi:hypothetical protein
MEGKLSNVSNYSSNSISHVFVSKRLTAKLTHTSSIEK